MEPIPLMSTDCFADLCALMFVAGMAIVGMAIAWCFRQEEKEGKE